MNGYLIPANSKKSTLIFNLFTPFDLTMFSIAMVLAPACVTGFLVMPVPNYHNIFTVIQNAWIFFTNNQRYKWKGWCFTDGKEK